MFAKLTLQKHIISWKVSKFFVICVKLFLNGSNYGSMVKCSSCRMADCVESDKPV
jgi:hypothetical protein